nr:MAG TPA: hypothetical protein [Caudoviricetes sp.]
MKLYTVPGHCSPESRVMRPGDSVAVEHKRCDKH